MKVITVRNVHEALPLGIRYLMTEGEVRESRNGPVLVSPVPVATVYEHPEQRVIFYPERDANPFFHLYEAMWMLQGRNDLAPLLRYVQNFGRFSDDGLHLHGAYGYRWRDGLADDQLSVIANRLRQNKDDRRSVLQIWDAELDLDREKKDIPCNLTATFQRRESGELDMVVFNRSNDIILGAYGANAVHFSFLQEYVARMIGCRMGTYTQISVNYHAYRDQLDKMDWDLPDHGTHPDPYETSYDGSEDWPKALPSLIDSSVEWFDDLLREVMFDADSGFTRERVPRSEHQFIEILYSMLKAHHIYKSKIGEPRYVEALREIKKAPDWMHYDWTRAGYEWLNRRYEKWLRG